MSTRKWIISLIAANEVSYLFSFVLLLLLYAYTSLFSISTKWNDSNAHSVLSLRVVDGFRGMAKPLFVQRCTSSFYFTSLSSLYNLVAVNTLNLLPFCIFCRIQFQFILSSVSSVGFGSRPFGMFFCLESSETNSTEA